MLFTIHNLPVHFGNNDIESFIKKETKIPTGAYELEDLHIVYNKNRRDHTKTVTVHTSNESVGELIMVTLDGMYLDCYKLVVTNQPSQEECESSNSTRRERPSAFNQNYNLSQQNDWSIKSTRERSRSTESRRRDSPKSISDVYRSSEDQYRALNSPSVSVSSWKPNRESRRRNESDCSFKRASRSPHRSESGRKHESSFQKQIEHSDDIKQFGNEAFFRDQRYNVAPNFSSYSEKDNSVAPLSRWDQKEWPRTVFHSNMKSDNSVSDMLFLEKFVQAHANVIASQNTGHTEAQKVDILKATKTLEPFSPFIYYYTSDIYKKIFERTISFQSIYGKHVTDCSGEKINYEFNKTKNVDVHKRKETSKDLDEPPEKKSVGEDKEQRYNKDKETSEAVAVPHYYYVNQFMVDPVTGRQGICQIPVANSSQNQDSGLFYYGQNQTMPTESLISHDGFYAMMQQATLPYYYGADQVVLANQDINVSKDKFENLESDDEFSENYSPIEKDIEARTDAANYLTSELVNKFRIGDLLMWKKNEMALKINANIRKEFDSMFGESYQTNFHDIIANYEFRHDIHDNAELINAIHLTTLHPETQTGSSNKNKKLVRELTALEKKAVEDEIESLIGVASNAFMDPFNEVEKALGEAAVDRGILEYLKETIKENVVARIMGLKFKLQVKLDFEKKQKPKGLYLNEFLNNFGLVSLKHVSQSCVAEINYFRHLDKLCSINATKIGGVNTVIRPVLYGGSPIKLSRKIAVMRRKSFFKGPLLKKYNSISRKDETETTKSNIAETALKSDEACSDTGIKVKHKTEVSTAKSMASNDTDNDDVEIIENIEMVDLYSDDEMDVKDMEIDHSDQEQEISNERTTDRTITYGASMASVENENESQFGDQITNVKREMAMIDTANVTSICQESDFGANECQNNENKNSVMEQSVEIQLSDNVASVENENAENSKCADIENSGQLFDNAVTNNTSQIAINVESTNNADHENDLRCEFNHNTDIIDGDNDNKSENGDVTIISEDNENNGNQEISVKCDFVDTTDYLNAEKLENNNAFTNRVIENLNSQNNEKENVEGETARLINLSNCNANNASTKDSDPINNGNLTIGDYSEVTKKSDDTSISECQDGKCQDVGKNDCFQDTDKEVIKQGHAVKNDVKCQDAKSVECEDIQKDVENPDIECQNESLCEHKDEDSRYDENVEECDIYAQDSENCSLENDQYLGETDEKVSLMETTLSSNHGDDDEAEDLDELDPNYVEEWGDMWTNIENDNLEDY